MRRWPWPPPSRRHRAPGRLPRRRLPGRPGVDVRRRRHPARPGGRRDHRQHPGRTAGGADGHRPAPRLPDRRPAPADRLPHPGRWRLPDRRADLHPARHPPAPLTAFGATVNASGSVITVRGRSPLGAADVVGEDIRAATALVVAALAAEGTSTIRGMYHLRRGYVSLLPKLAALGADLTIDQEQS
ncbi:hypothetical protein ACFZCK_11340 [Kitasatospora purpeofusca]|uniref:hypothetical protein n=1 Tax=Kitasatospora purpeofusca TaxID=67352 RepID=UPI0036E6D240